MKLILISLIFFLFFSCEGKPTLTGNKMESQPPPKVIIEKEEKTEKEDIVFKPDIKIKLKRDGKDNYSWEISGSDPDEILKVNEKFRKRLSGDQGR